MPGKCPECGAPIQMHLKRTHIAQIHAFSGEPDAAFDWLKRAYRQKDLHLAFLKGDPFVRSLEHDPRYDELLRKLHLLVSRGEVKGAGFQGFKHLAPKV